MPSLLVCSANDNLQTLHVALARQAALAMPDLQVKLWPEPCDPLDIIAAAAWYPPPGLLGSLPKLQMVASIAAGVEHILAGADVPPHVPVTRIVDTDQAQGMADYMLWASLYYQRQFDQVLKQHTQRLWHMPAQQSARDFRTGIMGLGTMGAQVATRLRDNGFTVSGWSRSPRTLPGVQTFAGEAELPAFLAALDLVICLLPLTPSTILLCDARFFAQLKPGAAFVNAGRGEHVVLNDLVAALDSGHLRGAMLDVFTVEPLPPDDALWGHPGILVTPHMASAASNEVIASQIVNNVQRLRQGLAPLYAIDRSLSY